VQRGYFSEQRGYFSEQRGYLKAGSVARHHRLDAFV
jgi:hypothetical protein